MARSTTRQNWGDYNNAVLRMWNERAEIVLDDEKVAAALMIVDGSTEQLLRNNPGGHNVRGRMAATHERVREAAEARMDEVSFAMGNLVTQRLTGLE